MNNQFVIFVDWDDRRFSTSPDNIDSILNEVAKDVLSEMFKYGYTSSDLDYKDVSGNKYVGIISLYKGDECNQFLK
jgi:hypothetical protein